MSGLTDEQREQDARARAKMYAGEQLGMAGKDREVLLRLLDAERARADALSSALQRTEANFRTAVKGKPVRDMTENLAENAAALNRKA